MLKTHIAYTFSYTYVDVGPHVYAYWDGYNKACVYSLDDQPHCQITELWATRTGHEKHGKRLQCLVGFGWVHA